MTPHLKMRISQVKRRITPLDQVLIALQFYGTGTFQTMVGNVLKYSQPTVCRAIHDVSQALCMIAHCLINFPPNLLQVIMVTVCNKMVFKYKILSLKESLQM